MNEKYLQKIRKDFYYFNKGSGNGNSFQDKLFSLIIKADLSNRALLAKAYPEEVQVVQELK